MNHPYRYILSGHSGATEETFLVPYNMTLVFYANEGQTCYVPENTESLSFVLREMMDTEYQIKKKDDIVPNYKVEWNQGPNGVFQVNQNETLESIPSIQSPILLKDALRLIQRKNGRQPTTVYCVFCRGSEREFANMDFGDFKMDFNDFEFANMDFKDFDGGKKKKTKRRKKKRKRKTKRKRI